MDEVTTKRVLSKVEVQVLTRPVMQRILLFSVFVFVSSFAVFSGFNGV